LNNYWYLGLVENEKFTPLVSENNTSGRFLLTSAAQDAGGNATGTQLSLVEYEGSAVMVRGIDGEGWIYSATVVDHAGPILTLLVRQAFRSDEPLEVTP